MSNYFLFDTPGDKGTGTWAQTGGAVNANYPLTNIDDGKPWNPVIFTANPSRIYIDHGSAVTVDLVSFIHCNFPAGYALHVQRGAAVGVAAIDVAVTCPGATADSVPANPWVDLTVASGYGTPYRYTWLECPATATLLSLGLVRLTTTKRQVVRNIGWGAKASEILPMIERVTDAGTQIGYSRGTRARRIAGAVRNTDASYATLQAAYRACLGRARPFLFILDPTVNEAMWVKWGQTAQWTFDRTFTTLGVNDVPIDLEEVGRGLIP